MSKEQLPAATAQNQAIYGTSQLIGPPVAGILFGIGRGLPFLADAVSYAVSVVSLLFIRARFEGERSAPRRPIRQEIAEGVTWLWNQRLLRFMASLSGGINLLDSGWALVIIVLAQQEMHATPGAIGVMLGVSGVGEIAGSILGSSVQRRLSYGRAIAGVTWAFAIMWSLVATAPNLVVVGIFVAGAGLAIPSFDVVQFSYRVAIIPDELQGRVNSVYRLIAIGTMPLGLALMGALLQWIGPRATILCVGAGLALLALAATLNPHVQHAPSIEAAKAAGTAVEV